METWCGIMNKNQKKRGIGMSIESRSRQYGKIFDHWHIRGDALGYGSQGKTAVFRLTRSDSYKDESALKVINLIEKHGNITQLSDIQRKEYEDARDVCSKKAEREVYLMHDLMGKTNIVGYLDHTVSDWEEEDRFGRDLLIRMELLTDLRSELKKGKIFHEYEIIKIGKDICTALKLCHNKNIIHRDVKPENIFFNTDGDFKLGDFGISRVLDACGGAFAGTRVCTYEYCPLEQLTGQYDKRVDIYSLGLVLYELSNRSRLPFASSSYASEDEVRLRFSGRDLPKPVNASSELAEVILKACAHNPKQRYQTAEAFLKALESIPVSKESPNPRNGTVIATPDGKTGLPKPPWPNLPIGRFFTCVGIFLVTVLLTYSITRYLLPNLNGFEETVPEITEATVPEIIEETVPNVIGQQIVSVEAGRDHTVALYSDGTVKAIGSNQYGQCDTADWMDIEKISTMRFHTVGVKSNGTVVAAGLNDDGQCNVAHWENIIDISAGDHHTVGLKSNGTVVATGYNQYGECDVAGWSDIIAVEAAFNNTIGLKSDGTVLITGAFAHSRLSNWSDIVSISVGDAHFVGLRSDGSVVAAGTNNHGQCDLSEWSDIVSVCAGAAYTVGLRSDGTVLVEGINDRGQHEAQCWNDIEQIGSGIEHIVGIRSDGTLVAVGANDNDQCDVDQLDNLIAEDIVSNKLSVAVGDMISFGQYEQDGNQKNGPENIEWMVLDVQGNRALLLSHYALDAQPYNIDYEAVTWETSTIRNWLNNAFFNNAFTIEEQNSILLTTVDNSALQGNKRWSDQEQNNTKDNVFLLSYEETDQYFDNAESRLCIPTNYAISMGAEIKTLVYGTPDTGWWWLRSPGEKPHYASFVNFDGERYSNAVGNGYLSVRPALWVDLDSDALIKVGELSEDNTNSVVDTIRKKLPIVTYAMTDSDEVYSYSDSSLSRQTDWYYFDSRKDEIVIMDVSADGNALFVRYPSTTAGTGYRDCWFAAEDILGSIEPMVYTFEAAQRVDVYRLESSNSLCYYGTIWNQPECYNLGSYKTGDNLVIYPMSNFETIWGVNVTEKMALMP